MAQFPMSPLSIIFAGSGSFGAPTLRALLQAGHRVVQVYSQPDRPAGRGRKLAPTPIALLALEKSLPLIRTQDINGLTLPPADVMIVIAFGQKISGALAAHPRLGAVNLHASLLPKYRGAAPVNWAILRGETVTGNSVIRLAEKMDAGAILGQESLPIDPLETAGDLHDRLSERGPGLMIRVLEDLAAGRAVETEQNESQATSAPKLTRKISRLDWTQPAEGIGRQIRALHPWPGCRVRLLDAGGTELRRLTLVRARPAADEGPRWRPGEIMTYGAVAAGQGGVEILELLPEGKTPMKLADYQRGNPWGAGMRLEAVE
jgi:methionyl-tRNA formyltransferase